MVNFDNFDEEFQKLEKIRINYENGSDEGVKKVKVFLSLPMEYKINWNEKKESQPRISVLGFSDPDDTRRGWNSVVKVKDYSGEELPENLYIMVRCSGYYRGEFGGSSWFADYAFISKENAEKYAEKYDGQWERHWVIQTHRKV